MHVKVVLCALCDARDSRSVSSALARGAHVMLDDEYMPEQHNKHVFFGIFFFFGASVSA